jgi:hypothetical protein
MKGLELNGTHDLLVHANANGCEKLNTTEKTWMLSKANKSVNKMEIGHTKRHYSH